VDKRVTDLHDEYVTKAWTADQVYGGVDQGTVGPVDIKMLSFEEVTFYRFLFFLGFAFINVSSITSCFKSSPISKKILYNCHPLKYQATASANWMEESIYKSEKEKTLDSKVNDFTENHLQLPNTNS